MASSAVIVFVLLGLLHLNFAFRHLVKDSHEISIGATHIHKEKAAAAGVGSEYAQLQEPAAAVENSTSLEDLESVVVEEEARAKRAMALARAARAEIARRQGHPQEDVGDEEQESALPPLTPNHPTPSGAHFQAGDTPQRARRERLARGALLSETGLARIDADADEEETLVSRHSSGWPSMRRRFINVIFKPIVDVAKDTVTVAKMGYDKTGKEIKTGGEAIANFIAGSVGDLCKHAITLAMDTVIVDEATGVDWACAQMCGETDATVELAGGGPEDPAADTVDAVLTPGCALGCAMAFDSLTWDKWGTDEFSEAICGYCGL